MKDTWHKSLRSPMGSSNSSDPIEHINNVHTQSTLAIPLMFYALYMLDATAKLFTPFDKKSISPQNFLEFCTHQIITALAQPVF